MKLKVKNVGFQGVVSLLLVLMVVSGPLWARGAYKWVDDDGIVHYSDRMRGTQASVISVDIKEPEPAETDDSQAAADEKQDPTTDKDQVAANAKAAKEQQKLRKANCAQAREQLATNESLSRMYRAGKNGERVYLTDKERGDVIRRSLDSVKYWCK